MIKIDGIEKGSIYCVVVFLQRLGMLHCVTSFLKKYYALYMNLFTYPSIVGFIIFYEIIKISN